MSSLFRGGEGVNRYDTIVYYCNNVEIINESNVLLLFIIVYYRLLSYVLEGLISGYPYLYLNLKYEFVFLGTTEC